MSRSSEILILVAAGFCGMLVGNQMGDQLTIKDCATKNRAEMMGGGTITCHVVKESEVEHPDLAIPRNPLTTPIGWYAHRP